ncbi:hypothetical protein [Pseudacidovorax intermedius]|uniref:Glycerate kinase n=1 Tax=Pseudacidovorax intermedius TaxID=433924 RepID=A0A147GR92_9BURK|nr:hypothetical protein [Pseudacidovorax intermedius]KTT18093.1 glycerate kinase [Pseudacidovorax intermedius]
MTLSKILVPVAGLALLVIGWRSYGLAGFVGVAGGIIMFLLLHFTRTMTVLRRAGNRPMGYVDSAVMLNAKLKPRMTLLHVIAMTRSIGAAQTPEGVQPEVFRWTDNGDSYVDATFLEGKLQAWKLTRPVPVEEAAAAAAVPPHTADAVTGATSDAR